MLLSLNKALTTWEGGTGGLTDASCFFMPRHLCGRYCAPSRAISPRPTIKATHLWMTSYFPSSSKISCNLHCSTSSNRNLIDKEKIHQDPFFQHVTSIRDYQNLYEERDLLPYLCRLNWTVFWVVSKSPCLQDEQMAGVWRYMSLTKHLTPIGRWSLFTSKPVAPGFQRLSRMAPPDVGVS